MYTNILVAVDGSPTADKGLREALALASATGASVTALSVVCTDIAAAQMQMAQADLYERHLQSMRAEARAILDGAAAIASQWGVALRTELIEAGTGLVADAIVQEAGRGFDLLVMGTHGRRGFQRFMLGSDAESVLRRSPVPVLVVREPGAAPRSTADMPA